MGSFCYLYLTCDSKKEASKISNALLAKRLIVCAKLFPISADYHWQGKIEHSNETLLIMESRLDLFDVVESEITKLHSYDTIVLEAVPIAAVSKKAAKWMNESLK